MGRDVRGGPLKVLQRSSMRRVALRLSPDQVQREPWGWGDKGRGLLGGSEGLLFSGILVTCLVSVVIKSHCCKHLVLH